MTRGESRVELYVFHAGLSWAIGFELANEGWTKEKNATSVKELSKTLQMKLQELGFVQKDEDSND